MSATLPPGLDPRGMRPYFRLRDWQGMPTHTIDQFAAAFRVVGFSIRAGHSGDFGEATITIQDDEGEALDRTSPARPVAIRYGQIIEVYLGRDRDSAVAWFLGIVQEPSTNSPAPNRRIAIVRAVGYAQRLADRFASVSYSQRRLSDGISPDPDDAESYVSAILYHALNDAANRDSPAASMHPVLLRRGQTPSGQTAALANRRALAVPSGGLADPGGMAAVHGSAGTRKLLVWDQGTGQSRFRDYDYTPSTGVLSGERDLAGTASFLPHRAADRVRCVAAGAGAIVGRLYLAATNTNFELRGSYDAETGRASAFIFSALQVGAPIADAVGLCFVPPNQFVSLDTSGVLRAHPAPAPGGTLGAGTVISDTTGGSYTVPGSPLVYGALAYDAPRLIVSADGVLYDLRYVPGVGVTDQRTIRSGAANVRGLAYLQGKVITAEDGASSDILHDYDYDQTVSAGDGLAGVEPKIDHLPVLLPDFIRRHQPLSTIAADLAAIGNCVWGVAPDRYFFMRVRAAHDSGILLTNDVGLQLPPPAEDGGAHRPTITATAPGASGIAILSTTAYVLDRGGTGSITAYEISTGAAVAAWNLNLPSGETAWGLTVQFGGGWWYILVSTEYDTGTTNQQGERVWRGYVRRWRVPEGSPGTAGVAYGNDPFHIHTHQDVSTIDGLAASLGASPSIFILRARAIYDAEILGYPAAASDAQNPVAGAGFTYVASTGDTWDATGITVHAGYLYVLDAAGSIRVYDVPEVPRAGQATSTTDLVRRPTREFPVVAGGQGIASDADSIYVVVPGAGIYRYLSATGAFVPAPAPDRTPRRSRTTDNWDKNKLCIIRNRAVEYSDTGVGGAYTSLLGLTATRQPRVYAQGEPPNASQALHMLGTINDAARGTGLRSAIAIPFLAPAGNLSKLSILMGSAADVSSLPALSVAVIGSRKAEGPHEFAAPPAVLPDVPNREDVRAATHVTATDLDRLLKNRLGEHVFIPLDNVQVTPGELLWAYIPEYGDGTRRVSIDYKTGTDAANPLSYYYVYASPASPPNSGGVELVARAGTMALVIYGADTVSVRAQNTTARRAHPPKEAEYPLRDNPDTGTAVQALAGVMGANARVVRKYGPLAATPTAAPPPLGTTARMVDVDTGLDTTVEIAGWEISGSAHDPDNLAPNMMGFTVVDRSR